jgi:hypothetical protein
MSALPFPSSMNRMSSCSVPQRVTHQAHHHVRGESALVLKSVLVLSALLTTRGQMSVVLSTPRTSNDTELEMLKKRPACSLLCIVHNRVHHVQHINIIMCGGSQLGLARKGDVSGTQYPARGHSPIAPMSVRLMALGPVSTPDSWELGPVRSHGVSRGAEVSTPGTEVSTPGARY